MPRLTPAVASLLALTVLSTPLVAPMPLRAQTPAAQTPAPQPSTSTPIDDVPGPLRATQPPVPVVTAPVDRAQPVKPQRAAPPAPPKRGQPATQTQSGRPITWSATLQPIARPGDAKRGPTRTSGDPRTGGDVKGRITADVGARQLKFSDFQVPDRPDLEVWLTAADPTAPAATQMESKHVSLGRLRKPRGDQTYKIPAELDLSIYRTLLVWSRHTRSADAFARLVPGRVE